SPYIKQDKGVKQPLFNHLLQHTKICLSFNGEIPVRLNRKSFSPQLESDVRFFATAERLTLPRPRFGFADKKLLSLSSPLMFVCVYPRIKSAEIYTI
ncbi:MAG: hypothetical protein RR253_07490, partial [Oscillospiraceae bacterium]